MSNKDEIGLETIWVDFSSILSLSFADTPNGLKMKNPIECCLLPKQDAQRIVELAKENKEKCIGWSDKSIEEIDERFSDCYLAFREILKIMRGEG